jgi:hypothetical protein
MPTVILKPKEDGDHMLNYCFRLDAQRISEMADAIFLCAHIGKSWASLKTIVTTKKTFHFFPLEG